MSPASLAARFSTAVAFLAALLAQGAAAAEPPRVARSVLVLYTYGRMLPANLEFEAGLRRAFQESGAGAVELFEEFLDLERFDRTSYLVAMETYLREKYAGRQPDAVVAAAADGLGFLIARRERLFPGVPIVHAGVDRPWLAALGPLPPDAIGVPWDLDFRGTIELALRLHPRARRVVLVSGASPRDRFLGELMRDASAGLAGRAAVETLAARPHREMLARLATLGDDSVVVTVGYFEDGEGREFLPRDSARELAGVSEAPLYTVYSTMLGAGAVGGSMATFGQFGREAGRETAALLRGVGPAEVQLPERLPAEVHLDWRQLRRWGVDERSLPADAVIHFRAPGFFEEYRREALAGGLVFAVQAALIGLLLVERRRRRAAELARQAVRTELMHASRLAVAGELVGSIAHEINQPLGAIQANADAADLILASRPDRVADLRAILADIRRDDQRASEVIRRLRTLLAKGEVEKRSLDLEEAVREVERLLRPEARRRGAALEVRTPGGPVPLLGDRIQLQQVVINLVLNGLDAVANAPADRKRVEISLGRGAGGNAVLTVRDLGAGIALEHLPQLFESFFTTKSRGMGLGLAIARTIVEAHGGRIRAENDPAGGAVFRVELPVSGGEPAPKERG